MGACTTRLRPASVSRETPAQDLVQTHEVLQSYIVNRLDPSHLALSFRLSYHGGKQLVAGDLISASPTVL